MSTIQINLAMEDEHAITLGFPDVPVISFSSPESPSIELSIPEFPQFEFDVGTIIYEHAENYEGLYEANALFSEQVFSTAQKHMTDDFSVHAINYTEAQNDSGITLTIGG